ncbi:Uncharacterised protein [Pseudomonas putida]|nr:Uncharacterised protein [Pseudomonas putida]
MIDPDWFKTYEQLPFLVWRGVYVDTAQKTGEQHDFSVFAHCGLGRGREPLHHRDRARKVGRWRS